MKYSDLKSIIASKSLLWQYEELEDRYLVYAVDGFIRHEAIIYKAGAGVGGIDASQEAANILDFESNYKSTANMAAYKVDAAGIPSVSSSMPTSSELIDTREGVYKSLTPIDNIIEWTVPYSYIILMGIRFEIKDTEAGDKISLIELGFNVGGNWVQAGWYGKDIYFAGGQFLTDDKGNFKSEPIPQGLTFRFTYTFSNQNSIIPKPCSILFKFGRPIA